MTIKEFLREEDARFNAIVLANKEPQVKIEDAANFYSHASCEA